MSYIFEGLYLGDIEDAYNSRDLRDKKGISHILTVDCKPLVLEAKEGFVYKYVHALDVEDFDLLSHFDECIKFIEDGRKAGGVLIHCYAGQSRSATIAVAYLMARQDLVLAEALQLVRKMRPSVGPNPGFMQQLELFEAMENHVDSSNPNYRRYRLNQLAAKMVNCNIEESSLKNCLSLDPSLSNSGECVYTCKLCSRPLFQENGIVTHPTGFGHSAYKKHSKTKGAPSLKNGLEPGAPCAESIFIEPVAWMQSMILNPNGKLSCPKCGGKIGSYRWSGEQCPCGQWVTPAFHMQKSKLDYSISHPVLIRRPNISMPAAATNSSSLHPVDQEITTSFSTERKACSLEPSNS